MLRTPRPKVSYATVMRSEKPCEAVEPTKDRPPGFPVSKLTSESTVKAARGSKEFRARVEAIAKSAESLASDQATSAAKKSKKKSSSSSSGPRATEGRCDAERRTSARSLPGCPGTGYRGVRPEGDGRGRFSKKDPNHQYVPEWAGGPEPPVDGPAPSSKAASKAPRSKPRKPRKART